MDEWRRLELGKIGGSSVRVCAHCEQMAYGALYASRGEVLKWCVGAIGFVLFATVSGGKDTEEVGELRSCVDQGQDGTGVQ